MKAAAGRAPAPAAAILGCLGTTLSPDEAAFFRDADPFGFILFARNVEDPAQLARLTADLRAALGRDAPVMVDQEGGRVQRLRAPHWREWLAPLDQVRRQVQRGSDLARGVWLRHRLIAHELHAAGIDADCAPCCDIAGPQTHPFLQSRCWGMRAEEVTLAARAACAGLLAGGVLPILKHLPGHGRARVDSHHDLPRIEAGTEELFDSDFRPFADLAMMPMAMTAHIVLAAIDPAQPATTSAAVIEVIRSGIGFQGFLMSDDIGMNALAGTLAERAARAVAAGCDAVLHCNGSLAEMAATIAATGRLSPAAMVRAAQALARRTPPEAIDTALLDAEFEALLEGARNG